MTKRSIAYLVILTGITLYMIPTTNEEEVVEVCHESPCIVEPTPQPTPGPTATPSATPIPQKPVSMRGVASYYSREGCLGCDPAFRTASGDILDDSKHTMALAPETVKKYKAMGKVLKVTNPKTNITIEVKVNDTGGFSKYGRIADLSLASKNSLGCGDLCEVIVDFGNAL